MVDIQATERALRIGQARDVTIYRFITEATIEERIYHRQIFKKYMADKVLQDPARRRLFERDDIYSLLQLPGGPGNHYSSEDEASESVEEGQLDRSPARTRIRCMPVTSKTISKDKKYLKFA